MPSATHMRITFFSCFDGVTWVAGGGRGQKYLCSSWPTGDMGFSMFVGDYYECCVCFVFRTRML